MLSFNPISSNSISDIKISGVNRVFDVALDEIAVTASSEISGVSTSASIVETNSTTSTESTLLTISGTIAETFSSSSTETTTLTAVVNIAETTATVSSETSSNVRDLTETSVSTSTVQTPTLVYVVSLAESASTASTETSSISLVASVAESTAVSESSTSSVGLLQATINCAATVTALLDLDGNTEGSPAGTAAPGFTPLTSVVLAQHIESAPAATYTVTADFDPLLETEITSVFFNDNPANVLSYSIIGPDVFITTNTPADVYAQASTFMVNRKVVPQFNEFINYNVRFNTIVKRDNDGRNFYSNKFYSEQNVTCFLQDDGAGAIDLYEEVTPGTTKKLKTVGRIDYTTGFVEVRNLMITSLYDLELFFFVESLDSIIPTKDYFTAQNNLLVQSKTITFPTGEQVEISQYEKQTDIVDLEIYVTARSYALANPLTTVETRTAKYVLRIVPDYDLGKNAIKQLVLEQAA